LYSGDLGLVELITGNSKVWLRLIPRIDMNPKKADFGANKASRFSNMRPPQKAFN